MDPPARGRTADKLVHILGQYQHSQDIPHPVQQIGWNPSGAILFNQAFQPFMANGKDYHLPDHFKKRVSIGLY
jgi:hypothetical protein